MALVHDDDLTQIDGLSGDTVSGDLSYTLIVSMFLCV